MFWHCYLKRSWFCRSSPGFVNDEGSVLGSTIKMDHTGERWQWYSSNNRRWTYGIRAYTESLVLVTNILFSTYEELVTC